MAWYVVIPYLAQGSSFQASDISLFRDLDKKVEYVIFTYLPFMFLPLLNWRWLLFTGPPLGINLIGKSSMYSGYFHYADMLTAIVAIASLEVLMLNYEKISKILFKYKYLIIFPVVMISTSIPKSHMQKLIRYYPDDNKIEAVSNLEKFIETHSRETIEISSNISPLINHTDYHIIDEEFNCEIDDNVKFIVFYKFTYRNQTHLDECIANFEQNKNFNKLQNYKGISVYQVN